MHGRSCYTVLIVYVCMHVCMYVFACVIKDILRKEQVGYHVREGLLMFVRLFEFGNILYHHGSFSGKIYMARAASS